MEDQVQITPKIIDPSMLPASQASRGWMTTISENRILVITIVLVIILIAFIAYYVMKGNSEDERPANTRPPPITKIGNGANNKKTPKEPKETSEEETTPANDQDNNADDVDTKTVQNKKQPDELKKTLDRAKKQKQANSKQKTDEEILNLMHDGEESESANETENKEEDK